MAPRANVALRMPPPEMHSALTGTEDLPVSSLGRMNLRSAATTSSKRKGGSGALWSNMPADYVREPQPSQHGTRRVFPVLGNTLSWNARSYRNAKERVRQNATSTPGHARVQSKPAPKRVRVESNHCVAQEEIDAEDEDENYRSCRHLAERLLHLPP